MMKVNIECSGVIPAGGKASRIQPLPYSKEMTLINGRPIIDYLAARMERVCSEIIVISRQEKTDVNKYCEQKGYKIVMQSGPELSGALIDGFLLAKGKLIFWGLPDTVWSPVDALKRLGEFKENALGLFPVDHPERFTVIESKGGYVSAIHGKVANPPSNWIWGIGMIKATDVRLAQEAVQKSGGSNTCEEIIKRIPFRTLPFEHGKYLDIGSLEIFSHMDDYKSYFNE